MRLLGLIGGTSWHATVQYYKLINQGVGNVIGTQGNPPLLIYSLNIELMRTQDWNRINNEYLRIARMLERAGAEALMICANTPHTTYSFVQPQIGIPILHIADAVGTEATRLGLKKLGLLGNKPTMTGDFISGHLKENYFIETFIPEAHCISQAHTYISEELTRGSFTANAKRFFMNQIDLLRGKGAEGIILGCTELPLLIEPSEVELPTLSTTDLHAAMAVDFILGSA